MKKPQFCFLFILSFLSFSFTTAAETSTPRYICAKNSDGSLKLRSKCKRSETKLDNQSVLKGAAGTNGTNGADGADGSLRIYGSGATGALTVASNTSLINPHGQYTDISIASGATLTVFSGAVIRCTGTFTNQGTISVTQYAHGEQQGGLSANVDIGASRAAVTGWGISGGGHGSYGTNGQIQTGGASGFTMSAYSARTILHPGPMGGGGGGAGIGSFGGQGGGTVTILCQGAITNEGAINADADTVTGAGTGSGGGAGGIVIIGSPTSITNSAAGSITARGAPGGASISTRGAGGGGGGGIVHLISPTITSSGTISVSGGAAGSNAVTASSSPRGGGGSGGSCAGGGGAGGSVASDNTTGAASAGATGASIETLLDPTTLF